MDPATLNLALGGIQFAAQLLAAWPQIRAAATTDQKTELDAAYAAFQAQSNAAADTLRATPDDPV